MIRLRLFAVVSRYFIRLILNIGRDQRGTGSDAMIGLLELSFVPAQQCLHRSTRWLHSKKIERNQDLAKLLRLILF